MGELADSFDTLADSDMWTDIGILFGSFLAGTVVRNLIEPHSPWDLPDEVYGVAIVLGAGYLPEGTNIARMGGGLYTVDKLAERLDLKQRVTSVGDGGGN
ncbi:hypothetical protein EI982_06910 [Haloplanus rallus]|uniref:Uncharacterized protein n=1 Tax=Haloplanus rallus TaxID=1816183 RepID=A0A6B9F2G7_9EURY|nr:MULTISPECIES: hypothetical protein [Haloplanus]QGX94535.1 hypothetical protein EI982_06910 [Haloplanus rallus]